MFRGAILPVLLFVQACLYMYELLQIVEDTSLVHCLLIKTYIFIIKIYIILYHTLYNFTHEKKTWNIQYYTNFQKGGRDLRLLTNGNTEFYIFRTRSAQKGVLWPELRYQHF